MNGGDKRLFCDVIADEFDAMMNRARSQRRA
jgi:hypothetical protein